MTCLGVLDRGERGNGNGTGLKERGLIEMSTTVLPFTITIITIYYSDTINISNLKKNTFSRKLQTSIDDTIY